MSQISQIKVFHNTNSIADPVKAIALLEVSLLDMWNRFLARVYLSVYL
ncbi:hypothetical protein [Dapis sp. BLCC M229]